jgi:hypothetical protein
MVICTYLLDYILPDDEPQPALGQQTHALDRAATGTGMHLVSC